MGPSVDTPPAVLIIEDEPVLRSSMVRGLLRDSTTQVVGAATVAEARSLIEQLRPGFIISDLDLPDGTGLEVIDILDRLGMRVPILFASAYVPKYRPHIPSRSEIEVREKPIPLRELRAAVEQRIGVSALGNSGEVGPFAAPDYIQLACMCHRSVEIRLERRGALAGRVFIQDGELFDAEYGSLRGEAAVLALVYDAELLARCLPLRDRSVPRVIKAGWQNVLLEAARLHDESQRDAGPASDDWSGTFVEDPDEPPFVDDDIVVEHSLPPSRPPRALGSTPASSTSAPAQGTAPRPTRRPMPVLPDPPPVVPRPPAARALPPVPTARTSSSASTPPIRPPVEARGPWSPNARQEFERSYDEAVEALLSKDYEAALRHFSEAQIYDPKDPRVRANIERLKVLRQRGSPT